MKQNIFLSAAKKTYLALLLLFLYAPIVVMIVFSFNSSKLRTTWGGFTLKWYFELFQNEKIMEALYVTLAIAFISAVVATIIGTAAAFGIHAMPKVQKGISMALTNIPMSNPDIVTGISLMMLFVFARQLKIMPELGFFTLLLAHTSFNLPYVILSVLPKIRQLDEHLYEAALDLGAKPWEAFTKVILPEVLPGIITGAIFAFTLSLDDFIISYFTTGRGVNNLSIYIYSTTSKKTVPPEIYALSTLMFLSVIALLVLINKRDKKHLQISQ